MSFLTPTRGRAGSQFQVKAPIQNRDHPRYLVVENSGCSTRPVSQSCLCPNILGASLSSFLYSYLPLHLDGTALFQLLQRSLSSHSHRGSLHHVLEVSPGLEIGLIHHRSMVVIMADWSQSELLICRMKSLHDSMPAIWGSIARGTHYC